MVQLALCRIYLRMLVCVPGKKLRELLKLGEQLPTMAPSGESDTFFNMQAPILSHDPRKSRNISAYIHLERVVPLLVKQSWSLSLANLGFGNAKADSIEGIKDSEPNLDHHETMTVDVSSNPKHNNGIPSQSSITKS